jgi:hypothetical protein
MALCESRKLCPAFGVMSTQVVSSLLKLRESHLPPQPLFIPVRRIIGDRCCSLHRGDAHYSVTSTSSTFFQRSGLQGRTSAASDLNRDFLQADFWPAWSLPGQLTVMPVIRPQSAVTTLEP